MSKPKSSNRYKINFNNPRCKIAINYMVLGESRISRTELMSICGKDIFYALSKNGFITEYAKGQFKPSEKLKTHVRKTEGKHFSSSRSTEHSSSLRHTLNLLPKDVLIENRFQSAYDIEHRFKKEHSIPREDVSYLTPDYQVTLTQDELQEYIHNLERYQDELSPYSRGFELLEESIDKLKSLPTSESVTINCEVVTSSYGTRELEAHRVFEQLSQVPQIYIV